MTAKSFADLATQVAIGPEWNSLKDEYHRAINLDVELAGAAISPLLEPAAPKVQSARLNMARHIVWMVSLHEHCVVGLLGLVPHLEGTPLVASWEGAVAKLDVDEAEDVLSRLDVTSQHHVAIGFAVSQELLIRHHVLGESGQALHRAAHHHGLQTGSLPATLHPFEVDHRCMLPFGGPWRLKQPARMLSYESTAEPTSLRSVLDAQSLSPSIWPVPLAVRAAHEPMVLESNGRIETRAFDRGRTPSGYVNDDAIDLDGPAVPIPGWQAAQGLFLLSPGAYCSYRPVWLARAKMAEALGAFVGAPASTPFFNVLDLADASDWWIVEPAEAWADHVAWDYGLACVGGGRGVVLVATDTD